MAKRKRKNPAAKNSQGPRHWSNWSILDELLDQMAEAFDPGGDWDEQPPVQLPQSPLTKEENSLYAEIVQLGFREASKKYHPDRGGDERKMAAINALKDKVYQIAGIKK